MGASYNVPITASITLPGLLANTPDGGGNSLYDVIIKDKTGTNNVLDTTQAITQAKNTQFVDANGNVLFDLTKPNSASVMATGPLNLAIDVKRDYNASGSAASTTGSISAASNVLTITGTLPTGKDAFQNGQGIAVANAGPLPIVSAPTAATATAEGATGSTTIDYAVAAIDANGGITASFAFSVTNANATLSKNNYVLASVTPVTNAVGYAWYRTSTNGTSPTTTGFIGITSNSGLKDVGLPVVTPLFNVPSIAPSSPVPAMFITSISSGGGTTSLTLAATATTAVTSGTVIHDDTVALQNAYNALTNGGTAYHPAGTYNTSSKLTVTNPYMRIIGAGKATILCPRSYTQDMMNFSNTYWFTVSDLTINYGPAAGGTAYVFSFDDCQNGIIKNLRVSNCYNFVRIGDGTQTDNTGMVFENIIGNTTLTGNAFNLESINGVYLLACQISGSGGLQGAAITLPSSGSAGLDTLFITQCLFQQFGFGLIAQPSASVVQDVWMTDTVFDGIAAQSLILQPSSTGIVTRFEMEDCWFTSEVADCVVVDAPSLGATDGIYFRGCRMLKGYNRGFLFNSANPINIVLDGCMIAGNSVGSSGTQAGVQVAAGTTKFAIRNCKIGQDAQLTNTQSYAIALGANCDLYSIQNNDLTGNLTGAISDGGGTTTSKLVSGNRGYNPLGSVTPPASPLISGTVYQNASGVAITIYQPAYATVPGTAGTVAVALGPTSTPSTIYTEQISGGSSSAAPRVMTLRIPPGYYYSFTATGATLLTANMQGE